MAEDKGFRIEIEDVEKIYERLTQCRDKYNLGNIELADPFEHITVSGFSNGDSYTSLAQLIQSGIDIDLFKPGNALPQPIPVPTKTLEDKFKVKQVRNTIYILDDQGKPKYEIDSKVGGINIYFGGGNTPSKKIGTLDEFVAGLKEYKELIETTVNGVYVESGREDPDIVMYLRAAMAIGQVKQNFEPLKDKIVVEKRPDVNFKDIGGLEKAKKVIQGLSFALKNSKLYKKWGTHPPRGILLHGPSGTGKTLMAKALAREADANFYHVKVSDITSKWYGESESLMQAIFDMAKEENGKTIIFFDEIDTLVPLRRYSHEATGRIISTMLENLDGLSSSENVMVVGSTNRLKAVDPALTRPGRIDRLVEVPLPDEKGRKQIFEIHKRIAEKVAERELFSELNYETLLKDTEKYSGADIAEILRRTLEEKVRQEGASGNEPELIKTEDVIREIENYERTKKDKEKKEKIGFRPR